MVIQLSMKLKELGANGEILKTGDHVTIDNRKYEVSYEQKVILQIQRLIDITVKKVWDANVPMSEQKSVEAAIFNGATEVDFCKVK